MPDPSRAANALTIMMTDVVGSTELRRARGDQDADDILALQAAIVQHQVAAFGGWVRKSLGDGFLISFHSDVAAVRAGARRAGTTARVPSTTPPIRDVLSKSASASTPAKSPSGMAICSGRRSMPRPASWPRRSVGRS